MRRPQIPWNSNDDKPLTKGEADGQYIPKPTDAADKQILTYNYATRKWEAKDAQGIDKSGYADGQVPVYNAANDDFEPGDGGKTYQPGTGIEITNPDTSTPTISSTLGSIAVTNDVADYASLPTNLTPADAGQYWVTRDTSMAYRWNGSAWPDEGEGIAVSALTAATIITTALAGSNHGLWLDCTDPASMYTDMAATTPVTVDGDAVAVIKDKSGLGFDASQSDPAKRAIYRRDGSGRGYLEFDGSKYYDAGEAGWAPTFTVMAYGTPTTSSDSRVIDTRGSGSVPGGWQIKFYEAATTLYLSEGSAFRSPGGLLPVSSDPPWLIVGLNDATSARTISISDTEQAQGTDSTPLSIEHYSVTRIGAASNNASQAMVGRVYQIFFVDRVLEYAERRRVQLALSQ